MKLFFFNPKCIPITALNPAAAISPRADGALWGCAPAEVGPYICINKLPNTYGILKPVFTLKYMLLFFAENYK